MITVRAEQPEDREAIHRVNELAFGRPEEGDLVDNLRASATPFISLVAIVDEQVSGHISFSPVTIESDNGVFIAIGLAPMSVLPEYQNKGIGSLLVREGLKECMRLGHDIVVVLGHPNFYPKFGFSPASLKGLRSEYAVADEVFMVIELGEGALNGRQGLVRYHPAFGEL